MTTVRPEVASPCTGVCTLDSAKVCIGCRRTLAEIAAWGSADDAARLAILQRVKERS